MSICGGRRRSKFFVVPGERSETRDPYSAAYPREQGVWVPAFAGTTIIYSLISQYSATTFWPKLFFFSLEVSVNPALA